MPDVWRRLAGLALLTAMVCPPAVAAAERALSADVLFADDELPGLLPMSEYVSPPDAAPSRDRFSGRLRLLTPAVATGFRVLEDGFGRVSSVGERIRELPLVDIRYVQAGADLVPLERGVLRTGHPYWEIVLQPGRVWHEAGDGEWSRAAAPFALQERAANCTHYGVMTWLFNGKGEVSRAAWQIAGETCAYFRFDAWGTAEVTYEPEALTEEGVGALTRFRRHNAARLPVRPLADLSKHQPAVDPGRLGFADGLKAEDLTVMGLVVDGIHYRSTCPTRAGPYPFCASLPLPSYSTAKSIFAGLGVMRMERLWPGTSGKTIGSLTEACGEARWGDVTVENALDMATGNYDSAAMYEDEDAPEHLDFIFAGKHERKLELACALFPRRSEPGTRFVYHTSDTYLVGVALQRLLDRNAAGGDVYRDLIVGDLWRPLELSPLLDDTKRTYDDAAQPFTGYGLTYEADDILRIARWLAGGGDGLLDEAMLQAALQQRPDDRGLVAAEPGLRYNNGFWAYETSASLGCEHEVWVPFLSGFGGITVALFPNGVVYYYFSDGHLHRWGSGRDAAHRIGSLCDAEW